MNASSDKRIVFFDVLRAIAIILVVITHYRNKLLPGGSVGVSIFFCLSGYLIAEMLLHRGGLTGKAIGAFYIRRFFRVFPAYVFSLALVLLFLGVIKPSLLSAYLSALPSLIFFIQRPNQWLGYSVGVLWTLQIEFWFYIALPIVIVLTREKGRLLSVLLGLIVLSWLAKAVVIVRGTEDQYVRLLIATPAALILWMDNLLFGVCAALWIGRGKTSLSFPYAPCMAISLVGILLLARFVAADDYAVWLIESSFASLLTAIVIVCFKSSNWGFAFPGAAWIGGISYSIYLLHGFALDFAPTKQILLMSSLFAIIIGPALVNKYIERPGIACGKRLAERLTGYGVRSGAAAS